MRICIRLSPEWGYLEVPVHYNHIVQGYIYRNLDKALAKKYHSSGFGFGKRSYKFFTFSRLSADRIEYTELVEVSEKSLKVMIYKNYIIKGWLGVCRLSLPVLLFRIAYNAGLGARNSLGFGMVEVVG